MCIRDDHWTAEKAPRLQINSFSSGELKIVEPECSGPLKPYLDSIHVCGAGLCLEAQCLRFVWSYLASLRSYSGAEHATVHMKCIQGVLKKLRGSVKELPARRYQMQTRYIFIHFQKCRKVVQRIACAVTYDHFGTRRRRCSVTGNI